MAWRPHGTPSHHRRHTVAMPSQDLFITSTGRGVGPSAPPTTAAATRTVGEDNEPIRVARSFNRRSLDAYSNATMATSSREGSSSQPYWANPQGFDMYQTSTGSAHSSMNTAPRVRDILKHPSFTKAPLSDNVHYVEADGTSGLTLDPTRSLRSMRPVTAPATSRRLTMGAQRSQTAREFTVREESDDLQATIASGESQIAAALQQTQAAARPLVTHSPSSLPFGSHVRESESAAKFRIPPKAGVEAVTFYRENPEAAVNLNSRERQTWRSVSRAPPPLAPSSSRSGESSPRHPQSFRAVPGNGMSSTTHTTYVQPSTNVVYETPSNLVEAVAARPLTSRGTQSFNTANVPKVYETTNQSYGIHEVPGSVTQRSLPPKATLTYSNYFPEALAASSLDTRTRASVRRAGEEPSEVTHGLRPTTAPVRAAPPALAQPSGEDGNRWREQLASANRRFGESLRALQTEYREEYRPESARPRDHHLW